MRATPRLFGNLAVVCFACAALALIALHLLRPDRPPSRSMISSYAVGPYGWVMTTCFLTWGFGCSTVVLGLISAGLRSFLGLSGAVLLGVVAVGFMVSAVFPMDVGDVPRTVAGQIHDMSFYISVPSFVVATLLLSINFGRDPLWRSYRRIALTLALLVLISVILLFVTLRPDMPYGIAHRLGVVAIFAWLVGVSLRLRAVETQAAQSAQVPRPSARE